MATFAKIGLNNKVIEVLSVHNNELLDSNGVEQEVNGIDFLTKLTGWAIWKQTSYLQFTNKFAKCVTASSLETKCITQFRTIIR